MAGSTIWLGHSAAGWAALLNQSIGVHLPLAVMSLQHGVILSADRYEAGYPTLIDNTSTGSLFFIKPESGGTILIGLDKEDPNKAMDPDTYHFDPDCDALAELAAAMCRRIPAIRLHQFQNVFGALDSVTPDWNPMLGFAHGLSGRCVRISYSAATWLRTGTPPRYRLRWRSTCECPA